MAEDRDDQTMMFGFCEALLDEKSSPRYENDSDGENDRLVIASTDSDTEDELSDEEGGSSSAQIDTEDTTYTGKDGTTIWYSNPNQANISPRPVTLPIITGATTYAKDAKSELDCWKLFFSDDIIEEILHHTNVEIKSKTFPERHNTRVHIVKETTMDELLAIFGLMYIAGINNSTGYNLTDLWRSDGTGVDIFRMTMSLQRFNFLQNCLRFDDAATRAARKEFDNIAPVRMMFEKFVDNCQKAYTPSDCLTIDETCIPFRGDCPFRHFMPNSSSAYGIKLYALVDAKVYYTYNLEIHAGKQPDGLFSVSYQPSDVVDRLVKPVTKTKRNVTFDNRFTTIPLVKHLLHEHGLTATGALRKNKMEIPNMFLTTQGRKGFNSSRFGFTKELTLVSYMPKKSKVMLLLSSLHHDRKLDVKNNIPRPEIATFYDSTKTGVAAVEKLSKMYDVRNYCKGWPLLILFNLMNIATINSYIIYRENNNSKLKRCEFIRKLGLALLEQHLLLRKNKTNLPRELRKRIFERIGVPLADPPAIESRPHKRCRDCPSTKDRKTRYTCIECQKPICLPHAITMCQSCTSNEID